MWWYEYYDRLYWIHIAYSGYTQCICGWGRKQTNQCLGSHEVHWNVSKFSKKILSEPVAINLWERFSTTRLIVLRLSWMKDSMSFTDAVQKNSRASSGKSQSDDQQSPNYSWNCSFTLGHLYLEQLSSSRGALALPALVSQSLIYQESRSSPANKIITLNRKAGRWQSDSLKSQGLFFFCLLSPAVISFHIEIEEENIVETGTAKSLVCFA